MRRRRWLLRLGVGEYSPDVDSLPLLDRKTAESVISLDGRAEVRVRPTQVRIVLAAISEGKTAQECQRAIQEDVTGLRNRWQTLRIPSESIVEDFIAILPVHSWVVEKRGDADVGVEQRVGFRMQTNVHVSAPNDETANAVLTAAFEQGIADVIAVDYWSPELDAAKVRAREQALRAARTKADMLLKTLFDTPPAVMNVQERTTVRYPESLYDAFQNSYQEEVTPAARSDMPFLRAYRPRNTYYRGLQSDGDIVRRRTPDEAGNIRRVHRPAVLRVPGRLTAQEGSDDQGAPLTQTPVTSPQAPLAASPAPRCTAHSQRVNDPRRGAVGRLCPCRGKMGWPVANKWAE